ncbi:T9SS type A sorting domain-containing protein [Fluviicola sp.]|jgi:polyhydroxybutyrate depolymerase|uniref:T9SS type A sorting domain-containing protein n=1 Tax=Fluviicola sp. TaxID=1917219 RepID=UPI00281D934C|nr:PHB depolymerase family esterase [Fluviicola sp.]MDR0801822.1 T9SS type A sorting domain-containing protein [Fluviicola sp.]
MNKIFTLLSLWGLSIATVFGQLTDETVTINGVSRSYKLYIPAGFNPQTESPDMIIIMHGLGGTNSDMVAAGFNNIADTARVIAVYPQALNNSFGMSAWNNGTLLGSTADDLGFMHALINRGLTDFNVNPARVYAAGFSMGSIMSHHMACAMNQRIAAIGAMSGTMATSDISSCVPAYKTPVIHLHGTADGTVPYNGTALPSLSLVPQTIDFWRGVHGCAATADSTRLPDTGTDTITIDRFVYDNCDLAGSLELWRFNGAGHVYLYKPVSDIDEMIEVWKFLSKWNHPNPSTLDVAEASEQLFQISPNPSNGMLKVTSNFAGAVQLVDLNGALVFEERISQGVTELNFNSVKKGIYLIRIGAKTSKIVLN